LRTRESVPTHSNSGLPSTLYAPTASGEERGVVVPKVDSAIAPRRCARVLPRRGALVPPAGRPQALTSPGAGEGCAPRGDRSSTRGAPHGSASRPPGEERAPIRGAQRRACALAGGPRSGAEDAEACESSCVVGGPGGARSSAPRRARVARAQRAPAGRTPPPRPRIVDERLASTGNGPAFLPGRYQLEELRVLRVAPRSPPRVRRSRPAGRPSPA